MNTTQRKGGGASRGITLALALAILSSAGSIAVAVAGGWQRGAAVSDQSLLAMVSVIAVLAAQLLPALGTRLTGITKACCLALWLICVAYTAWGHAWYLLAAQERAGMARAEAIERTQATPVASPRDLTTILNDKARITELLARLQTGACDVPACADRQRFRMAALNQRVTALDAEVQALADFRQSRLRREEQQRQAKEDLVGIRLASSLGVSYVSVTWMMALTFALVLEGVGCFCWAIILGAEAPDSASMTARRDSGTETVAPDHATSIADVTAVTNVAGPNLPESMITSPDRVRDSSRLASGSARDFHEDVARVTEAMCDLDTKVTVTRIRNLLHCSQLHAQEVRKFIASSSSLASPGLT